MEEVLELSLEEDYKDVKEVLNDHGGRIGKLEIDSEVMKERWNNISTQLNRIENNSLTNNNAMLASNNSVLQTMNKLVEGNTTKNTNKKEVIIKGLTDRKSVV